MKKATIVTLLLSFAAWLYPLHAASALQETNQEEAIFINYEQFHKVPNIQPKPVNNPNKQRNKAQPVQGIYNGRYNAEANGEIQVLMQAKVIAKWGEEYWPAMHYILDHESGSDPYAVNPHSGACGIPQALPCSKLLTVIGSLDNVDGQLDWMINYVASRYSDPIKAMAFHQAHNWY